MFPSLKSYLFVQCTYVNYNVVTLQLPHAAVFLVLTGDCDPSPVVTVSAGFGLGVAGIRAISAAQASLNLSISFASVNFVHFDCF